VPLGDIGREYYQFRANVMKNHDEGLTTIYNWFNDPEIDYPDILRLREQHDVLDRVVLDAYDWRDIRPKCEFIPEFENEDEEDGDGRQRKKKYRYRWADEVRDEVLAQLLKLNRGRALEEGRVFTKETESLAKATKKASKKKSCELEYLDSIFDCER
jgi:hypothetical protein